VAEDVSAEPGTLVVREGFVFVGCAKGTALRLDEVQIEGRKRMSAAEFLRGQKTVERLGQ
jgi:methionyl-tRNA formyltransferase